MRRAFALCLLLVPLVLLPGMAAEPDAGKAGEKVKEVAGTAEFLRSVPKYFATLKAIDRPGRRITFLVEGESQPQTWPLAADAEIKRVGWWGRLDQMQLGDRVWVWMQLDRVKQPVAVSYLTDELTEQDMHGPGVTVEAADGKLLTWKPTRGPSHTVNAERAECLRGKDKARPGDFKPGEHVYVQTANDRARLILDPAAFAARRAEQKKALRQRWLDEGLPGSVSFLHPFSGEMDLMLDHEAMRWGRSLTYGDEVTIQASPPIRAVVKQVRPWRERTQLRLVVRAYDQTDLTPGQRVQVRMAAPPPEVEESPLPPDVDRPRSREERIDWFLASVYCTCKIGGDGCTGHVYSLASCNVNSCGMPNTVRRRITEMMDKGLTDRQVFEEMLKLQGPDLVRPHLLP